jgi:UDP-glucose 4-epimerase
MGGAAGYIGSVVASQLVEEGHEVMILDNLCRGHRRAVPEGASFLRGEVLDAKRTARVLAPGFDGVLHFAALSLVGESVRHPERYYRTKAGEHRIYNPENGTGLSVRELVRSAQEVIGRKVETIEAPDEPGTRRCWCLKPQDPGGARLGTEEAGAGSHGLGCLGVGAGPSLRL